MKLPLDSLLRKKIAATDAKHLDPAERAELVNSFFFYALGLTNAEDMIEHPLYWDLLCYCVNFVLLFAYSAEDTELLDLMILVNNHVCSLHYAMPEGSPEFGLPRDEHTELWHSRIKSHISS
jgi:hypothetical protein